MAREDSPLLVRPRLDWQFLAWMMRFMANCRKDRMDAAIPILRDLSRASLKLFKQLIATEGLSFHYEQSGLMGVYTSEPGFEKGRREAEILAKHDFETKVLDARQARALEPALLDSVIGAIYYPEDAHGDSYRFVCQMSEVVRKLGAEIHTQTNVCSLDANGNGGVCVTTNRGKFDGRDVVVATGAWASQFAKKLGIKIPLQPAKGYSVTVDLPPVCPRIPLMNSEKKVAITPIGSRLRFAGTLELAGLDLSLNETRVRSVLRGGVGIIPEIKNSQNLERWCGLRPCTPDGLPVLDRVSRRPSVYICTGHGMLGFTLGPISGKLLAQMVTKEQSPAAGGALRIGRFSSVAWKK
jgi:D-amino-acid dehydrogenase